VELDFHIQSEFNLCVTLLYEIKFSSLCAAASPEQPNKDEPEQSGEVSEAAEALTPPQPQLALGKLLLFLT
jgi:hypothetical protein